VLDGVYTGFGPGEAPVFHAAEPVRTEEVEALVRHMHALVIGQLQRRGLLDQDQRLDPDTADDLDVLGTCQAAAIQGLTPFGQGLGHRATLVDEDPAPRITPRRRRSSAPIIAASRCTPRSASRPARVPDSSVCAGT
jgi:hypothetical protein